jgi:hypothetical protein
MNTLTKLAGYLKGEDRREMRVCSTAFEDEFFDTVLEYMREVHRIGMRPEARGKTIEMMRTEFRKLFCGAYQRHNGAAEVAKLNTVFGTPAISKWFSDGRKSFMWFRAEQETIEQFPAAWAKAILESRGAKK